MTQDKRRTAPIKTQMGLANYKDPKSYVTHLLSVAPYKVHTGPDGRTESIEISFENQITGTGTLGQALRGMQALGFDGVAEVRKDGNNLYVLEPAGQEGSTQLDYAHALEGLDVCFKLTPSYFDFGGTELLELNHQRFPKTITLRGEHNIKLAQDTMLSLGNMTNDLKAANTGRNR